MQRRSVLCRLMQAKVFLAAPWLLAPHSQARAAPAGDEIRLGQSATLSGRSGSNGQHYSEGAHLYFDLVNGQGGIHGRPVRLLTLDDGGRAAQAFANTAHLIGQEQVLALFGYSGTASSLAAMPLVLRSAVPFFGPRSGSELLRRQAGHLVFTVRASQRRELDYLVRHMMALRVRSVAMVHGGDAEGYAGVPLAAELLHRQGGQLMVAVAATDRFGGQAGTPALAERLLQDHPCAVVIDRDCNDSAAIIRSLRLRGHAGLIYVMSHAGGLALRKALAGRGAGVTMTQTVPFPWRPDTPIATQYRRSAEARGVRPGFVGLEGFIAAKVICEGLQRCGRHPGRQRLITALESINDGNYDAGGFSINFSAHNHEGSRYVDTCAISRHNGFVS